MSRPRKKWEPAYRFGGNSSDWAMPNELGRNQRNRAVLKAKKPKRKGK